MTDAEAIAELNLTRHETFSQSIQFGSRLRTARLKAGLSQTQAARIVPEALRAFQQPGYWSNIETGTSASSPLRAYLKAFARLQLLASTLGCTVEYLIGTTPPDSE